MRKIYYLLFILYAIIVLYSCKHPSPELYNPTSYNLQYPDFVTTYMGTPSIPTDNPTTTQGILLGRKLFYEHLLSNDKTMSCASCHKQENAFDDPRQFSQGTNGTFGSRNAMAIINAAWNERFFWDGRRSSLEGQAHDPVANPIEMANTWPVVVQRLQTSLIYPELFFEAFGTHIIDSTLVVKAIAQFERTLISFNSRYDQYAYLHTTNLTSDEADGYELFQIFHCTSCHSYGLFTDHSFRNNGLDLIPADSGLAKFTHNPADYGKFKVPTLRNIALTAPYMHDGRFATLDDVVAFYSKNVNLGSPNLDSNMQHFTNTNQMSATQRAHIVAFLKTLTDSSFIVSPLYSQL